MYKEKRKARNMDRRIRKFLIDILNLIFGRGQETDHFWQELLIK